MNDKEGKGTVSLEETMQIMYLRYGRQALDAQLEEVFGTSDLNSGTTFTLSQVPASYTKAAGMLPLKQHNGLHLLQWVRLN